MVAHRWLGPVPGADTSEPCECEMCRRHDEWLVTMEHVIGAWVGALLESGWLPIEVVRLVKSGSPSSSRASMLVRVDIVSRVPEWIRADGLSQRVAQARGLSSRTGFVAGRLGAGWFEQWFWNQGRGDLRKAERYVHHLRTAIEPVLQLIGSTEELPTLRRRSRSRPSRLSNGFERGSFVPEPSNRMWSQRS